jgi:hypothetical protein
MPSEGAINSNTTDQLVKTLNAANPPPGENPASLIFIADSECNDLVLRLNEEDPSVLEIFDNFASKVQVSRPVADTNGVSIINEGDGDALLTVDFSVPFFMESGIEYTGVMVKRTLFCF